MWGISVTLPHARRPCPEALPQCIVTRRTAPPSHGEKFHRRTIVTRRTAPPSHGIHPYIAGLAQGPNTSGAGNCVVSFSASVRSTRLETISSHGCGLQRHTAADNIVTRCGHISSHGVNRCGHISSHAAALYRHMV